MTTETLYNELNYVTHSRENRQRYARLLVDRPELLPALLDILYMVDDKVSCRAAWVLEFMCHTHLSLLLPHLDSFSQNLHRVHLDPAVRPVAKVCEYLALGYYASEDTAVKSALTTEHKERIVEVCFDWLINDERVAPKAYAMQVLYLFGSDYDWVFPELRMILERDFQLQSSGFKARAKYILKGLKR